VSAEQTPSVQFKDRQRSRYMSVRHVVRRVAVSIAATAAAGAFAALAFALPAAVPAGATTACAASGDQCLTAAQAVSPFTPGKPFDSGQNINVVVPANSAFASPNNTTAINIVECAAPNGVIPSNPASCDGNTIQGPTVTANANGSFTLTGYTVYALPDSISLGEGSTGVTCGDTLATECILFMGNNQNDFTKPHLWSQPFTISANGTDSGANPGDGTPEIPYAVLLPVSAMGLLGATVLIRQRRKARSA
jgi:hypothetical protein